MEHDRDLPADLTETADRLRETRESMDPLTDDRLRRRLDRAASRAGRVPRRSSLAVTLCLAFGLVFSAGGTGLAVSGLASSGVTATAAQYPTATQPSQQQPGPKTTAPSGTAPSGTTPPATTTPGDNDVLGEENSGDGSDSCNLPMARSARLNQSETCPEEDQGGVAGEGVNASAPDQSARQIASTEAQGLPFTGYAAIPLLGLGLVLLVSGAVLRRRSGQTLS